MTYISDMRTPTQDELKQLLLTVNVEAVAKAASVSTKTIYRYRWGKSMPRLDVLGRLLPAIEAAQKLPKRTEKAAA